MDIHPDHCLIINLLHLFRAYLTVPLWQADLGSKQLPVLKQKVLLGLLQVVDEVLSEANIPYWMTGGTLLGALRHEGFIPHDDDVDLECFEEDTPRIKAAFAASSLPGHFVESGHWEGPTADGAAGLLGGPRPGPLPAPEALGS